MMKAILRIYSEAYRGFPREVWMLCAVLFVNRTGSMVLAFLTLYLTKALGYSLGTASQVLAVVRSLPVEELPRDVARPSAPVLEDIEARRCQGAGGEA